MPVETGCGKKGYATSGEARRVLEGLRARTGDRKAGVYRCDRCRQWHLGTDRFGEFEERAVHLKFDLHKRRARQRFRKKYWT